MKHLQKLTALALAVLMSLAVLTACGKDSGGASGSAAGSGSSSAAGSAFTETFTPADYRIAALKGPTAMATTPFLKKP